MKKLLLPLFLVFILCGCKDKEEVEPNTTFELVKGEWARKLVTDVYINSAGNIEYSVDEVRDISYTITKSSIIIINKETNKVTTYTYTTSESNGKSYLSVSLSGSAETYELVSVTEQNMVWRQEKPDFIYFDSFNLKKAVTNIKTIEFNKI